jgi:FKBP-type peptidyl-prolyl cis-trans isomerase (trigger factor)
MFDLSLTEPIELKEWKNFAFKSPNRKRYKDLDKQVKTFLETQTHSSPHAQEGIIEETDWVNFSALLLDEDHKQIFQQLNSDFWIKLQKSELANQFKSNFIGKKQGESFITNELNFEDPSDTFNCAEPNFLITIKSVVKGNSLSIDYFKHSN